MKLLNWSEIHMNTVYVVKMTWGRMSGTIPEIWEYIHSDECRDYDVASEQPTKELNHFWNGYYDFIQRYSGVISPKEFYEVIYQKCPTAFDKKPETREKIFSLSEALRNEGESTSVVVEGCGNHSAKCWRKALEVLERDYDVINWTKKNGWNVYTVAGTKDELLSLAMYSNDIACAS